MVYIAFEGIDGAGKSTQVKIQTQLITENGVDVEVYEYSNKNNFFGRLIKSFYSTEGHQNDFNFIFRSRILQETLYALSARHNLTRKGRKNNLVISDRSIITAFASHLGKVPEWYLSLIEPNYVPDFAIYMDISPELGMERIVTRQEHFRDEDLESLIEFRNLYKKIIYDKRPKKIKKTEFIEIDATKSLEIVTNEIINIIKEIIK